MSAKYILCGKEERERERERLGVKKDVIYPLPRQHLGMLPISLLIVQ